MMERTTCFLVLHYNTPDITKACVASIKELEDQEHIRIVIVDNASPDGSGRLLKDFYDKDEQIDVICLMSNGGYSAGNNAGYAYLIKKYNIDFLILCNNDVLFEQRSFLRLIRKIYNRERFDILGPDVFVPEKNIHQSPLCKNPPGIKQIRKTILKNRIGVLLFPLIYPVIKWIIGYQVKNENSHRQYSVCQKDVCLAGCCLIFSADYCLGREKLFEPETFMYYEEFIQTLQCRRAGKQILYDPEIVVFHMDGCATNTSEKTEKARTLNMMRRMLSAALVYQKLL